MSDCFCTKYAGCKPCWHEITEERDRYRAALESIANPYVLDAEAQTCIARAALDGEG